MAEVVVGRLNGIETVLLDLDGTCRWVWSPSGGNEPVSAPRSWVHDFNRAVRGNMASAPFGRTLRLVGQADLGVRIAGLKGWSRSVTVTRQGLGKVPECQVHRLVMPRRAPGRWDGRRC
jgi:hypothetical protein